MMDARHPASLKAILGPTNTGKTYYAIERMLAHGSGMIGLPLRLLAREVYQTISARVGAQSVALVTGEERIVPAKVRYWVATVEAMPTDIPVECLAIDEIQTATSFDRGHVFTNRILQARGLSETLLLGAATMVPVIRALLPQAEIVHRPRLSHLTYAGSKKISRQPQRSAIVAFSANQVYAIAELIRRERGGAAVVMGALSPRTRNAQVDLYQNGDVDFLVATDAIGMGLNLDVSHVAFADDHKFDGHQTRPLTPAEFAQIAGRAGRYMRDGTFGVTGNADQFDEELVQRLEGHDFEPVRQLQWRNSSLDFTSLDALRASLDLVPGHKALTRVPIATDQYALEFLARNEAGQLAKSAESVGLLWECCQIPDYRDISPAQHGEIITRVYSDLMRHGSVDADWIAEQVRFCDNVSGDIDTLSNRIRQIRTWTFVANRRNWLEDPAYWREKTRDIEDRLSDALHERLTQRFVDRRTSVLIRHLRDKLMVLPETNDRGEVRLEGHLIGTLVGLRFTLAPSAGDGEAKGLSAAADQVIAPEIRARAERLAGAPNEEFVLATDGLVRWRGEVVADLAEGSTLLAPRLIILSDASLSGVELERVQERLQLWLRHLINTVLEPVIALAEPPDLTGSARGIAFQLYENLGLLPRAAVADAVKGLEQDVRAQMRKLGIKFGAYHIYLPLSLKPAPRELALILFALKNGGVRQPGVAELPQAVLSGRTSFVIDPEVNPRLYEVAGFKVAGRRAVRVDILERLADIIRPLIAADPKRHQGPGPLPAGAAEGNGFRVTVEMTSLLGCSGEDFASVLTSLGYRLRRLPKVEPPPPAAAAEPDASPASPLADGMAPELPAEAPADAGSIEAEALDPATEVAPAPPPDTTAHEAEAVQPPPQDAAPESVSEFAPPESVPDAFAADAGAADAGAPPPEPQFDEVWFPGRRTDQRPEGKRQHHRERARGKDAQPAAPAPGGEGVAAPVEAGAEEPRKDRFHQRHRRPYQPGGERPPREAGKPAERIGSGRDQGGRSERKPERELQPSAAQAKPAGKPAPRGNERRPDRGFDPDSPFAALAALRNRKPE